MGLNADRAGHAYPPYSYEVGREKVREYVVATALGPEPTHGDEVPPTFAATVTGRVVPMVVEDPALNAHWNLLHTGQQFTFHRPLCIGDVLRCSPRIEDLSSRRSMDVLTVAVDVTDDASGQPVLEASITLVFFDRGEG